MKILSLDLSTTNSGWAKLCRETRKLLEYGGIKPIVKNPKKQGVPLYGYPVIQKLKIASIVEQLIPLIMDPEVSEIVVEEINRGKNRLTQKVLDGLHHVLLDRLAIDTTLKITFVDSDGREGWRGPNGLNLKLSDADKVYNSEARKYNQKLKRAKSKGKRRPIVSAKTLACRHVNKVYNLDLNDWERKSDEDLADAIGLGLYFLTYRRFI